METMQLVKFLFGKKLYPDKIFNFLLKNKEKEILKYNTSSNENILIYTIDKQYPLHKNIINHFPKGHQIFLDIDEFGYTALLNACERSKIPLESIKALIEKGSDLTASTKKNVNILMKVSMSIDNLEKFKYLINLDGIEEVINQKDAQGETAIFYAVYKDNVEAVKILIEKGADLSIKSDYGHDIYQYSVYICSSDCSKYLKQFFEQKEDYSRLQELAGINV